MDSIVNVIPVYMPYASALFNTRAVGDRPEVVPKHSKNLAFVSQFAKKCHLTWSLPNNTRSGRHNGQQSTIS